MGYVSAAEAAKIIGITKRTLLRWDKNGYLPVSSEMREGPMGARKYKKRDMEKIRDWRKYRKTERKLLRELRVVNRRKDKFIATKPLDVTESPKGYSYKEMKEAYDAHRDWRKRYDEVSEKLAKFSEDWIGKIPDDE